MKNNYIFLSITLHSLNEGLTPPGLVRPNAHMGQMPVGGAQTMDQNTTQGLGLPEFVVSRISGPLTEATQDRTLKGHTQSYN